MLRLLYTAVLGCCLLAALPAHTVAARSSTGIVQITATTQKKRRKRKAVIIAITSSLAVLLAGAVGGGAVWYHRSRNAKDGHTDEDASDAGSTATTGVRTPTRDRANSDASRSHRLENGTTPQIRRTKSFGSLSRLQARGIDFQHIGTTTEHRRDRANSLPATEQRTVDLPVDLTVVVDTPMSVSGGAETSLHAGTSSDTRSTTVPILTPQRLRSCNSQTPPKSVRLSCAQHWAKVSQFYGQTEEAADDLNEAMVAGSPDLDPRSTEHGSGTTPDRRIATTRTP